MLLFHKNDSFMVASFFDYLKNEGIGVTQGIDDTVQLLMRRKRGIEVALCRLGPKKSVDENIGSVVIFNVRYNLFFITRKLIQHPLSVAAQIDMFRFPTHDNGILRRILAYPVGAAEEINPIGGQPFTFVHKLELESDIVKNY